MPYSKPGKLIRRVQKSIRKRKIKHRQAVKAAKTIATKAEKAQLVIAKSQPKVTAGELVGSGEWNWEGAGLSPDTLMEAQWTGSGWEYVPAKDQRKAALSNAAKSKARPSVVHSSSTDGKLTTLGKVRRDRSIHLTEDPDYPDDTRVYMIGGAIHLADVVDGQYSAAQCRGKTKDGTPCKNVGNCPVPSHRRNKV